MHLNLPEIDLITLLLYEKCNTYIKYFQYLNDKNFINLFIKKLKLFYAINNDFKYNSKYTYLILSVYKVHMLLMYYNDLFFDNSIKFNEIEILRILDESY